MFKLYILFILNYIIFIYISMKYNCSLLLKYIFILNYLLLNVMHIFAFCLFSDKFYKFLKIYILFV